MAKSCQRGGKVLPMGRQNLVIGVARKAEKGAFDEFL
jgi:arginine deiminase